MPTPRKIQNDITPTAMSSEDFGNKTRTKLLEDQESLNQKAGSMFDDLSNDDIGSNQPDVAEIKTQAKKIVAENTGYYDKHPEMLKGGAGSAWKSSIVWHLRQKRQRKH